MHRWTHKMNKRTITKRIIQAVAVAVGPLGLMWIVFGFHSAVVGFREPDRLFTLCLAPMFVVMGGVVVAIAWQNLRRFGPTSIRNVAALVSLLVGGGLLRLVELFEEATRNLKMHFLQSAVFLIAAFLAYLFYQFLSSKLIQLTEVESSQQTESTVPSKAEPEESSDVP